MMLMPSVFTKDLFDDFFEPRYYGSNSSNSLMKTDVKETKEGYVLTVDLPGVKKEDLKAELKDGCLTISATSNQSNDETDEEGRYIRRERFSGSFSRSFYVGDYLTQEDIKARFENGILTLNIPKKDQMPKIEEKKYIAIEG